MPGLEKNQSFSERCSSVISGIITFFVVILVTVFPLIYHEAYTDILDVKYICYYVCILSMTGIVLLTSLVMAVIDFRKYKGENTKRLLRSLKPENWKNVFRMPDVAVLVFWLAAVISTLQSEYLYESFWGNEGRYSGLFLLTLYVCSYFLISYFWKIKGWCLQLFLISGMIMCIIGITDYFQMDILGFRGGFQNEETSIFTSTVGNINTYTAYVGLVMGFSAVMFAVEKNWDKQIWYYLCMVISFFAIIMGCSDNAYIGLAALFGLSPFVLFRNTEGTKRYLIMLATFFSVVQCIDWLNQIYSDMVLGLESMFLIISGFQGLPVVVLLLWAGALLFMWIIKKKHVDEEKFGKRMTRLWTALVAIIVLAFCGVLYDANFSGNAERYQSLANYLVFSDTWGTARGYIWTRALRLYGAFPLMHKLFGYGPDTFGILTMTEIPMDMIETTGFVYDNAHNEYLHYLMTVGVTGAAAYITFLISAFYNMKKWLPVQFIAGALGATVCYAAQAFVNLNMPIAAPIMWLMLSVGMAGVREGVKKKSTASDEKNGMTEVKM